MMNKKIIFKISSRLQLILVKNKTKIQILKLILDKIMLILKFNKTKFIIKILNLAQALIVRFKILINLKIKKKKKKYPVNITILNKQN